MGEGVESDQPGDCPKCGMALERNPAGKLPYIRVYPHYPREKQHL
jgi:Cu+-exporting ATPase